MAKYDFAVCGGTFDLFHKGHEKLIEKALDSSKKTLIGITSNAYVKKFKNNSSIADFKIRKRSVLDYINKKHALEKVIIVEINSAYEPYLETSKEYDAIIVSSQTKKITHAINQKRKNNNLQQLEIVVSPDALAQDKRLISSSRIRNGEINRVGKNFINPKWKNKNLILPKQLRKSLKLPWGKIITKVPKNIYPHKTVAVGDYTVQLFNSLNVNQYLSIVDFLINREKRFNKLSEVGFKDISHVMVKSPAGIISKELFREVNNAFKNNEKKVIVVEGEEDLAVLPVILAAPLDYNIFYGQPGVGMVNILITEEIKEKAYNLINKFNIV